MQLEAKYPDQTVTDCFRIKERYRQDVDDEGNCYDWYEIDHHYRFTDKATAQSMELQAQIDYIAMMADIDLNPEEGA